jgi:drug/metabolite transporter (DMT)-like permease
MRSAGAILLAIWLILEGLIGLFSISFQGIDLVVAIVALLGGILLLVDLPRGRRRLGAGDAGFVLLGIFLILWALKAFGVSFAGIDTIMAIVALLAGVLLLFSRGRRVSAADVGLILLGVFLILWGLQVFGVAITGLAVVLAILALAAGVLILLRR